MQDAATLFHLLFFNDESPDDISSYNISVLILIEEIFSVSFRAHARTYISPLITPILDCENSLRNVGVLFGSDTTAGFRCSGFSLYCDAAWARRKH
jgi:hypothetical protein